MKPIFEMMSLHCVSYILYWIQAERKFYIQTYRQIIWVNLTNIVAIIFFPRGRPHLADQTWATKNQENSTHCFGPKGVPRTKTFPKCHCNIWTNSLCCNSLLWTSFAFSRLINENVLQWFLPIMRKEHTLARSANSLSRNYPTLSFWLRRENQQIFILNFIIRINWTVIFLFCRSACLKFFNFWNHAQEKSNRPVFVNMNSVFQGSHRKCSIKGVQFSNIHKKTSV